MKTISSLVQASALLVSGLPTAYAQYISWEIADVPSNGLDNIYFPMSIAEAPHEEQYYFAHQFNFEGQDDVGYTGLQPRPDSGGSSIIHAVFSSFIEGTTSDDENCSEGADGGPGYSCAADIPASYDGTYQLKVVNTEGTTWTGTLVHPDNNNESHIGTYTIPDGSGGITGSQLGFVENYLGADNCSEIPYTKITFGSPTTDTEGAGEGSLGDPYESGDCEGKSNFKPERNGDEVTIEVGFQ